MYELLRKSISSPEHIPPYLLKKSNKKIVNPVLRNTIWIPSVYLCSTLELGHNIFDNEWDTLVILDTCRPDALRIVADEYPFIQRESISTKWSVGGDSPEWIANTFDEKHIEEIRNTAYITSNPNAVPVLETGFNTGRHGEQITRANINRVSKFGNSTTVKSNAFARYESLYNNSVEHGPFPDPRIVTDYAINTGREYDINRLIVHYMPPHAPYLAEYTDGNLQLRKEGREKTYKAYLDNLRWVLDEVSLLLRNLDSETVVLTSDHGESFTLFGEDHISGSIHPSIRKVPWCTTTGTDTQSYEPTITNQEVDQSVDEVLKALGYID